MAQQQPDLLDSGLTREEWREMFQTPVAIDFRDGTWTKTDSGKPEWHLSYKDDPSGMTYRMIVNADGTERPFFLLAEAQTARLLILNGAASFYFYHAGLKQVVFVEHL